MRLTLLFAALTIASLFAVPGHATVTIPQCDPPTIPTIHPDGTFDCVMTDGTQPPPELGGDPAPQPAPAPAAELSPGDTFSDSFVDSSFTENVTRWTTYSAYASGCKRSTYTHEARSWWQGTLARLTVELRGWCYQSRYIYWPGMAVCVTTDVAAAVQPEPCQLNVEWFNWNGTPHSGLLVTGTAVYHNCLGPICAGDRTVKIEMQAHSDGSWYGRTA